MRASRRSLKRHLVCLDRKNGKTMWAKEFDPELPEHNYQGEGAYHCYAANTRSPDGQRLYVFFGKIGRLLLRFSTASSSWQASVGKGDQRLGVRRVSHSSQESRHRQCLDRERLHGCFRQDDRQEVWKAPKIGGNAFGHRCSWPRPSLADWCKGRRLRSDKLTEQQNRHAQATARRCSG